MNQEVNSAGRRCVGKRHAAVTRDLAFFFSFPFFCLLSDIRWNKLQKGSSDSAYHHVLEMCPRPKPQQPQTERRSVVCPGFGRVSFVPSRCSHQPVSHFAEVRKVRSHAV